MKKKVILIGNGGHAVSCIDIIENSKDLELVGIVTKNKTNQKFFLEKYKVLGFQKELFKLKKITNNLILGISFFENLKKREKLINSCQNIGFRFISLISRNCFISKNAKIGSGCQIFNNVTVSGNSILKDNVILNTGSIIEHDVTIYENSHISTGAIINGNCNIGKNTFVGSRSVLRQGIKVKQNKFIKMGSVLKHDL